MSVIQRTEAWFTQNEVEGVDLTLMDPSLILGTIRDPAASRVPRFAHFHLERVHKWIIKKEYDMSRLSSSKAGAAIVVPFLVLFSYGHLLPPQEDSLKERYASQFDIGVAVSPGSLHDEKAVARITNDFSSLTPENAMKPEAIWRPDGTYHFDQADAIVNFAKAHGMKVRGHTLVWHSQTPKAFFSDESGNRVDKITLYRRLEDYMTHVLGHYHGQVYCWDVVNEALADGGDGIYRTQSPWFEICGEEFIAEAFRIAHRVDPELRLYYNDYNLIQPAKRSRAIQMLRKLKEDGVPIDGVGMQAHWDIHSFDPVELQKSLDAFVELGLDVQITELDMTVYPSYHGPTNEARNRNREAVVFSEELERTQAEKYRQVFEVLRRNADHISSVTFWGLTDRYSWLNYYPVRGRNDYPLLFDRNDRPKKAYDAVMQ